MIYEGKYDEKENRLYVQQLTFEDLIAEKEAQLGSCYVVYELEYFAADMECMLDTRDCWEVIEGGKKKNIWIEKNI